MLGEMRQALFVHQPRNIAPVRYVANAPTDAGSWLASGLMTPENRNVCNKRIGKEAAERLITDVNVIPRAMRSASSLSSFQVRK